MGPQYVKIRGQIVKKKKEKQKTTGYIFPAQEQDRAYHFCTVSNGLVIPHPG